MKEQESFRKKKAAAGWIFLGIGIVMLCRSILLCFSSDIWYDELFTVGMLSHSYGEIAAFTAQDVHPPLYYCLVRLFCDLCRLLAPSVEAVAAAKLASTMPYLVMLAYALGLLRRRYGIFPAGLFYFCLLAMPQLSAYTVEIRMYSLALCLVTAALLHAQELLYAQTRRARSLHGAAFLLYGLAAAYTQYFACVAVGMIYLYVLAAVLYGHRERLREWMLLVLLSALGYAPWLLVLARQLAAVKSSYWILPLTWRSLGGCVKFLLQPSFTNEVCNVVFAAALFAIYAVCFVCCLRSAVIAGRAGTKENILAAEEMRSFGLAAAGLWTLAGLVLFGFAASLLIRPVFVYRYMLPAMGGFWLCFALCFDRLMDGKGRIRTALQIAAMLFLLVIGVRDYRAFRGEEEYKALLMHDTQEELSQFGKEDIILYNFDQVQMVTAYYLEDAGEYLINGAPEELIQNILETTCEIGSVSDMEGKERTEQIRAWQKEGKRVWFFGSFNSREDIVDELKQAGFLVEEKGSFFLERYWFNIYLIE